jgi:hypothetical protein
MIPSAEESEGLNLDLGSGMLVLADWNGKLSEHKKKGAGDDHKLLTDCGD